MPTGGEITSAAANVLQTGLGLYKSFTGASDYKKARDEQAKLADPFYKIQDEYFQNKNIAEANAGQGLPSATKNYLTTQAGQGLGTGISASLQGGGDPNQIAKLLQGYYNNVGKIGSEDALMHVQNIDKFIDRNKDLAGQKTMAWTLNEYAPYERKLKELKERMAAGKQNEFGGLSDAIGGIAATGTSLQNSGLGKTSSIPSTFEKYAVPTNTVSQPVPNVYNPNTIQQGNNLSQTPLNLTPVDSIPNQAAQNTASNIDWSQYNWLN